jgi:hypothetical protein
LGRFIWGEGEGIILGEVGIFMVLGVCGWRGWTHFLGLRVLGMESSFLLVLVIVNFIIQILGLATIGFR